MSLGGTVYNTSSIKEVGKAYNTEADIAAVIETGLNQPENSAAYKNAVKLEEKMKSGNISDFEIGQQVLLNEGATVNKEKDTIVSKAKKLIDTFSSYVHKKDGKTDTTTTDADSEIETTETETTEETSETETPTVSEMGTVETPIVADTTTPTEQRNTFTDELDELASTEMPTVSVGDVFVENSTGRIVKVLSRDATSTTVEITTKDGKTEIKKLPNKTVDALAVNDSYTQTATGVAKTATTTTGTVAPQAENTSVKVGDVYEAEGMTYTIIGRENGITTYTVTDATGKTVYQLKISRTGKISV
jgi:hypothetical protein